MNDFSSLEKLAESANAVTGDVRVEMTIASDAGPNQSEIDAVTAFMGSATPAAVLEMFAEIGRLERKNANQGETIKQYQDQVSGGDLSLGMLIAERDQLKAENDELRATCDLQKLLPEIGDALEDLELHGLHSDKGYRKLKDWYRKVGLAYRVIQGPMFGAEHGELVSQNTWLRSVVEHYAQQHAPLEPIPDSDGWSTRLPGYDLPTLLRDAERYRYMREFPHNNIARAVGITDGRHFWLQFDAADQAVDKAMRDDAELLDVMSREADAAE